MRDYYRMLGLPHGADLNEIRRAYREWHCQVELRVAE